MRPRQNRRHFADDIFESIFVNENVWISINISLKFVPKGPIDHIPALDQIMTWRRPSEKPLSEPMMINLPTHICVTRPQWVNENNSMWRNNTFLTNLFFIEGRKSWHTYAIANYVSIFYKGFRRCSCCAEDSSWPRNLWITPWFIKHQPILSTTVRLYMISTYLVVELFDVHWPANHQKMWMLWRNTPLFEWKNTIA